MVHSQICQMVYSYYFLSVCCLDKKLSCCKQIVLQLCTQYIEGVYSNYTILKYKLKVTRGLQYHWVITESALYRSNKQSTNLNVKSRKPNATLHTRKNLICPVIAVADLQCVE